METRFAAALVALSMMTMAFLGATAAQSPVCAGVSNERDRAILCVGITNGCKGVLCVGVSSGCPDFIL